jgi:hypothetical protein
MISHPAFLHFFYAFGPLFNFPAPGVLGDSTVMQNNDVLAA